MCVDVCDTEVLKWPVKLRQREMWAASLGYLRVQWHCFAMYAACMWQRCWGLSGLGISYFMQKMTGYSQGAAINCPPMAEYLAPRECHGSGRQNMEDLFWIVQRNPLFRRAALFRLEINLFSSGKTGKLWLIKVEYQLLNG